MNLPAHGTASLNPNRINAYKQHTQAKYLQHDHLAQPKCRQAKKLCRPPGGTPMPLGTKPLPDPLFQGLSPGGVYLAARRHTVQEHPW